MAIDLDEAKVNRSEFALWLAWTLATAAGMMLGFVPFTLLSTDVNVLVVRLLLPVVAGVLVGLLQWLVLRPYMTRAVDWVLHGGAGWALGFALGLLVIEALGRNPLGALLGYVLFGLIVGGLQWPMLRREIPHVATWVLASGLGWALGAYLGRGGLNLLAAGGEVSPVVASAVIAGLTGLVAGAVTGLALVWIVRQPDAPDAPAARA
ncbi:MAG: hypothetical protein ABI847_17715 [Anaerolineales bacterium]